MDGDERTTRRGNRRRAFRIRQGREELGGYRGGQASLQSIADAGILGLLFYAFAYYSRLLDVGPARYLHLPAVTCGFAIIMAVLSGRIIEVLQDRIAICLMALTFWLAIASPEATGGAGASRCNEAWIPSMMIFLSGAAVIVTLKQCRRSLYVVGVQPPLGRCC